MNTKPTVCVVDENPLVKTGWTRSLGSHANLKFYLNHQELDKDIEQDKKILDTFECIILGRLFPKQSLDIVKSDIPSKLKKATKTPLLLNWQGYVSKEDLEKNFDGKIFHRYGIKWQTLRLRIQRIKKIVQIVETKPRMPRPQIPCHINRSQRCVSLLQQMANQAKGPHKNMIEHYAKKDPKMGIRLLEAIYNKLLIDKNRPQTCPSRYINTSPVIAARILSETLQQDRN